MHDFVCAVSDARGRPHRRLSRDTSTAMRVAATGATGHPRVRACARASERRGASTRARAMRSTGISMDDLKSNDKRRAVVEIDGVGPLLIQEFAGDVFAMSNKCPHLGLSMQGKTALLSATVEDGKVTCNAHGSAFDMKTGAPVGEWCPKLPSLPVVGKGYCGDAKPIATYAVSVDEATGAISVDA